MGLLSAAEALMRAATVYMTVIAPARQRRELTREIEGYEDQIFALGDAASPADKLRLETISERERRAIEQLGALRPPHGDTDAG
ncbi:MAG TPA: hypothetical protein DCG72_12325 [Gammaproteobacteria bacterium]|nr:hypothetical protein [Gammaproteobacteria bacterium]